VSESFGARLRAERERRQVALKSISERTKIGIGLLEALERDDVSRWPSGIFRKSLMRSYAEAIGLDPEPIVREFLERYPDPLHAEVVTQEESHPGPAAAQVPARPPIAASATRVPLFFKRVGASLRPRPIHLRITIISGGSPLSHGQLVADVRRRWMAAACDAGLSCAIALGLFLASGHFWAPLGASMLFYYIAGVLIFGNTPGICLVAPPIAPTRSTATAAQSAKSV
jgi:transcriptional regulator with XRE-family HTH domain